MGLFDTVRLDREFSCPACGSRIDSVQVKAFDKTLEVYNVKACVSHPEETRIIKEELFCDSCSKHTGTHVYLAISRGILVGTACTFKEAELFIRDLNLEKLILWYHDLHKEYMHQEGETENYKRFLQNLREWFGQRLHERPVGSPIESLRFLYNARHLRGALNPVESIERFMTSQRTAEVLSSLWKEGHDVLSIYYPEDVERGANTWWVDVYQDEINERAGLNWTWTVISRKQLEVDGEEEIDLPEWMMVVDEPFSDQVVYGAIKDWLRGRNYEFEVEMIPLDQARGSGLVKELRERDLQSERLYAVPMEKVMEDLAASEKREMSDFIEQKRDKKKVFYYEGFYGSLVPDVEGDRLIGKIEGTDKTVVYEGKTVRECEQRFREAVLRYKRKDE
ncbi:MAG: hypothetical protein D4R88_07930 [Methanosarcinales archaeon]|nr:MAG: hypothetical protein D4R88_07930 [Methanosarcinales archaeon]